MLVAIFNALENLINEKNFNTMVNDDRNVSCGLVFKMKNYSIYFWGFRGVWFKFGFTRPVPWMNPNALGWSFMIGPIELRKWE